MTAIALVVACGQAAKAQSSDQATSLPTVTVESGAQPKARAARKQAASAPAQQAPMPQASSPASDYEGATGPVDGYVATDSASATKTGTPLIETPQTVNVITSDQMRDQGVTSVSQALRYVPGVVAEYRPSTRYDSMFIRGFGGGGNNANYVSFWDGLRIPKGIGYGIPTIDPYFLERVEVVKGPSSVLFGQISPGGFVNLVSKRPQDERFGEVETVIGSHNHFQTNFDFGGALNEQGTVSYRLTGLYRQNESHIDFSDSERFAIAPEFTFRPSDATTLTVQAYYQNDPEGGYYNGLPGLGTLIPYRGGQIRSDFNPGEPAFDAFEREQFSLAYFLEHRFDEVFTVRQNVRYTHLDSLFRSVSPAGYTPVGSSVIARRATHSEESFDAVTIDNQAEARFSTGHVHHTVLAGLDHYYRDGSRLEANAVTVGVPTLDFNNPIYGRPIPDLSTFMRTTDQTIRQTGLYLQDQLKFDNFVLVLGGRYDWSDIETSTAPVDTKNDAFSWRAGLLYNFDNGLAPYVSYSTSFEPTTTLGQNSAPLDPVEGEQFEVGIKYQPRGFNSFVTLSWFDITQSNVVVTVPGETFSRQLGEVSSRGFEAEAKLELTPNLNVLAAYAYTDAEITKDGNPNYVGKTPASVPEHMASLWAHYFFAEGPFAGLGVGAGVRYIGETYANNLNRYIDAANGVNLVPAKVDAFTLADASLRYDLSYLNVPEFRGWEVAVNATNLFDKDYVAGCLGTAEANTQCWFGDRRTVLGSLKYKW
ncbi:MAG TPA: TonB-dependent siderophore receptor [Hyphomicrobium sp.]|nr:TonB-dependent siderophore receptor [Hyphomicrobium sp.]